MINGTVRCIRCSGRKKLFKLNNGYTHINMGAPEVDCPMCLGKGVTKSIEETLKELNEIKKTETKKFNSEKLKRKDSKNVKKINEDEESV